MRIAAVAAAVVLMIATAQCCLGQDNVRRPVGAREVVPARARLTNHVVLIVDVSGSMDWDEKFSDALEAVGMILSNGTDDMEIAVIAFSDRRVRWPGSCDPDDPDPPPPGWGRLPSGEVTDSIMRWLSRIGCEGGTDPTGSFWEALREPMCDLTVILVTDGEFTQPDPVEAALMGAQEDRRNAGWGEAPIMVLGVGEKSEPVGVLHRIGRQWGGGFWVLTTDGTGGPW